MKEYKFSAFGNSVKEETPKKVSLFCDEQKTKEERKTFKYKFKKLRMKLRPYAIGVIRKAALKFIDVAILYLILRLFKLM